MEQFEKLGLCENVLKVISNKKFVKPSEIQEKTIPLILDGKDVIAGSATGSGKTLAFAVGMIKNVSRGGGVRGLILTPTRELCEQVAGAMEEFSYYKKLEVVSVYGGVSMVNQTKRLVYADIVVATPGRLLDHMRNNSVDLSKVDFLVLDEADRMWDMGFKDDVGKIVSACPRDRQTLLFSATISGELADFAGKYMRAPVEISVDNYVDISLLKQIYYDVRDGEKFSLLVHLLKHEDAHLVMIFCNTRRNVDFVAKNLRENGVAAQAIHGGMEQNKRTKVMTNFKNGPSVPKNASLKNETSSLKNALLKKGMGVIVCTDVAARGLDIPDVSHVYNYDLPKDAKDYVHRIGRTARAGAKGVAINILASRDYDNFSNIQRRNEGLVVKREMTPRFERVAVKFDEPRRSKFGGVHGRAARGRGVALRGRGQGVGGRRSKSDGRGRQDRGERDASRGGRSASGERRKKGRDGFRGRKRSRK